MNAGKPPSPVCSTVPGRPRSSADQSSGFLNHVRRFDSSRGHSTLRSRPSASPQPRPRNSPVGANERLSDGRVIRTASARCSRADRGFDRRARSDARACPDAESIAVSSRPWVGRMHHQNAPRDPSAGSGRLERSNSIPSLARSEPGQVQRLCLPPELIRNRVRPVHRWRRDCPRRDRLPSCCLSLRTRRFYS